MPLSRARDGALSRAMDGATLHDDITPTRPPARHGRRASPARDGRLGKTSSRRHDRRRFAGVEARRAPMRSAAPARSARTNLAPTPPKHRLNTA